MSNITNTAVLDALQYGGNESLAPEIQRMWCEDLHKHTLAAMKSCKLTININSVPYDSWFSLTFSKAFAI